VHLQANELLGLSPGQVFVQRNVGNLASHKDTNCMSCLEYAVNVLKVWEAQQGPGLCGCESSRKQLFPNREVLC
jgi:hypothetical protein